ncbi:MAG: preprotein translocase subunit SecD, partial [Lachnospiraceae bacterium]
MKKLNKGKAALLLVLLIVVSTFGGYLCAAGIGKEHKGKASHILLGLDLAGGVSITYEVQDKNPTDKEIEDTVYKLQKRVENYSTEASVYREGDKRISVEIPGVTDANQILEELGKPGNLIFATLDEESQQINPLLTGSDILNADATTQTGSDGIKEYVVSLEFTPEGTQKFAEATAANIGNQIYIIYDNQTVSAPTVQSEISDGKAVITGMENYDTANELATTIRIGALPLELKEVRSNIVSAKLGDEAISTSIKAGVIGFGLICVFMIALYLLPGFLSALALFIYLILMLLALNGFNVTLTLPGIAGIILSVGMAVDANVIIFTRIKEEIGAGKDVKYAIRG